MELAILVIFFIVISFFAYQARKSTISFNNKVNDEFNFKPIKLERIILGAIPFFLLLIGWIIDSHSDNNLNTIVAGILNIIIIFLLHQYIQKRTTNNIATKSILIIIVYGLFLTCLCVLMFFLYNREKNNRDIALKNQWYYPGYWW